MSMLKEWIIHNIKYIRGYYLDSMSTNSIFVLKPILDVLYVEARKDQQTIESLQATLKEVDEFRSEYANERFAMWKCKQELEEMKNKVQVLEQYNRKLHEENAALKAAVNPVSIDNIIDDKAYAAEANAPAHTYVEENEVVMPITVQKEDATNDETKEESTKTVKMVGEKTKKEYQREYQRAYRKKHKEVTMITEKYKA